MSDARQARLEDIGSGPAPVSPVWFTVNVRDAAWITNEAFGSRCLFEVGSPDVEARHFQHLGFKLAVFAPGQPSGFYHSDSAEEDFLVLQASASHGSRMRSGYYDSGTSSTARQAPTTDSSGQAMRHACS